MPTALAYRAVLFDLDGTLIDSAVGIAEAVNRTLHELGHRREDEATIRGWIGDGARLLLRRALDHAGADAEDGENRTREDRTREEQTRFEQAYARLMHHYGESLPLQAQAFPGAATLLRTLRARGVRTALCTNKPERFIAPLLQALDWRDAFDGIVGGDTLPQRKPSAVPLLHLAEAFALTPAQCLMVGDSQTDAEAARAAGMPLALVRFGYARGFDLDAAGAVAVVDDLRALV